MIYPLIFVLTAALIGVAHPAQAEAPAAYKACVSCHGQSGQGNSQLRAPRLAGQQPAYLVEQMWNFSNGARGVHSDDHNGQLMVTAFTGIDPSVFPSIASWLASQSATRVGEAPPQNQINVGADLYRRNCATCHGDQGRGVNSLFVPNLRILHPWYIKAQLQAYVSGWRGSEQHGTTRAKSMRSMAAQLSGEHEINAITSYLATL